MKMRIGVIVHPAGRFVTAILAGLVSVSPAMAGGLYISEFGTPIEGSAGAGANAVAEDASVGFHNAAGIVFLEEEGGHWLASVGGLNVTAEFKSEPGTVVPGNDGGDAGGFAPVASLFYSRKVSDKWGWSASLLSVSATLNYIQIGDAPVTSPSIPGIGAVTGRYSDRSTIFLEVGVSIGKGPSSR